MVRTTSAELFLAVLLSAPAPACRTPTETTIEIVADVAYRSDMAVSVQLDAPERVESSPARVVTKSAWAKGATVGSVVAVPSGDRDDFAVRVVLATGREPAACVASDATGCIVVRRRLHFVRGASTTARVVLRPACFGVLCDATSSCSIDGACGSLDSDEATGDGGVAPGADAAASDLYSAAVLADRPRHYYRLDEPEGATVAKDTMGRADGTYEGVKLGVTGALATSTNTGAFFDGARAAVVVSKAEDLPGAASIEAWIRHDTVPMTPATIVERVDVLGAESFGYRISRPPMATAAFEVFRGATSSRVELPVFRFAGYVHVAAVTRGGQIEVYVDGSRKTTPLADSPVSPVLAPLVIGASRSGAASFRGAIDELAIYDYPLEVAQIEKHIAAAGPKDGGQ